MTKTRLIIGSIPAWLDPLAIFLARKGFDVSYIHLANSVSSEGCERADRLRKGSVLPLTIEHLHKIERAQDRYYVDPERRLAGLVEKMLPKPVLDAAASRFVGIARVREKIATICQTALATDAYYRYSTVMIHAAAFPDQDFLLVELTAKGFLLPDTSTNVRVAVLPLDILGYAYGIASSIPMVFMGKIYKYLKNCNSKGTCGSQTRALFDTENDEIAFVTHKGCAGYGQAFQDVVYYSKNPNSERHPSRLLHLDYSGCAPPVEGLRWAWISKRPAGRTILFAVWSMVPVYIKLLTLGWLGFGTALLLTKIEIEYIGYRKELRRFPKLKLVLIEYDVLCPKSLLIAFEALDIKTVAAQERFILSMYAAYGTIVHTYLSAIDPSALNTPKFDTGSYVVERFVPVGQYRSDYLISYNDAGRLPPDVLQARQAGKRIITALGFITHHTWYESEVDGTLNWTAQKLFIRDMLRLATDIDGIYIVLRYKNLAWLDADEFLDIKDEIRSSKKIFISEEYLQPFHSYQLCAHSDLVIAKHTSLADECLAVGIPVLFHDYNHNVTNLVTAAFPYPEEIVCNSYGELREKASMLFGESCRKAYEPSPAGTMRELVYGGYSDGSIRARINSHIDSMLLDGRNSQQVSQ